MTTPLKPWVVAAVAVAVLLVAALPALAVSLASRDGGGGHPGRQGTQQAQGPGQHHVGDHQGRLPQPKDRKSLRSLRSLKSLRSLRGPAWQGLTPAEKAKKMAELSREHADAMQKWADCVAAAKDDCRRPLPPGLAKG